MRFTEFKNIEPQAGDILGLEFGDTLIEAVINEVREDGVVIQLDETAIKLIQEVIPAKKPEDDDEVSHYFGQPIKRRDLRLVPKFQPEPEVEPEVQPTPEPAPEPAPVPAAEPDLGPAVEPEAEPTGNYDNAIDWAVEMFNSLPNDILTKIARSDNGVIASLLRKRADKLNAFVEYNFDSDDLRQAQGQLGKYLGDPSIKSWKDMLHKQMLPEAEYRGRKVPLGKPMKGDVKKSKVYVKGPKGNVVKVNFGDPNMKIKKSNPKRRKSFRARHNCDNPGPRWKARYWSCRAW